jgi:polyhydroxybutyrate depolymerase
MSFKNVLLLLAPLLGFALPGMAAVNDRQWDVDGTTRTGIVCTPDADTQAPAAGWPVVFVFHGHGGSAQFIRRQFRIDTLWPQAVVVYLQGLPTVGQLTDPDGSRTGWDSIDTSDSNRDLRFYDVVLKSLIDHEHIDNRRVFCTGHSNGGGFTFTLWAHRGKTLAAIAASSSIAAPKDWPLLTAKPALMSCGRNDPLVKFAWQSKMIDRLKSLNAVATSGKSWGEDGTWYDSESGTPLATIITDGAHAPPADIGARIVAFFKSVSAGEVKQMHPAD